MSDLPRALLIAFHYPPVRGSSGLQRTLGFSSYLREFGWEPVVLTITPSAYESVGDDLLARIPPQMEIIRAFGFDSARRLSVKGRYLNCTVQPDRWVSWFPAAVTRGLAVIRRTRPRIMLSTYPIATAHMIGLALKHLTGIPWIADFRDAMTEPGYPVNRLTWTTNRLLESKVVRRSDLCLFTAPGTLEMYSERYSHIPKERWTVLENGYDEHLFREAEDEAGPTHPPAKVTLVHSGVLYPKERDPRPFFRAIQQLLKDGRISRQSLQVILRATGNDTAYLDEVRASNLEGIVEIAPAVAYKEALIEMIRASGLLLFQGRTCNHQIPAKLYEYLRANRPIFGLVDHDGDTARKLRESGSFDIADITNVDEIANRLQLFLKRVALNSERNVCERALQHSRRDRTSQLSELMTRLSR